jgi:hypothetical protein
MHILVAKSVEVHSGYSCLTDGGNLKKFVHFSCYYALPFSVLSLKLRLV